MPLSMLSCTTPTRSPRRSSRGANGATGRVDVYGSFGSWPAMASYTIAASATVLVMGPIVSMNHAMGKAP